MDQTWIVDVKDETGTAVTTAKVIVAPLDPGWIWPFDPDPPASTHDHTGAGTYEARTPIVAAEGIWLLAVVVSGKSFVTQLFRMKARSKDEMVTIPVQNDAANTLGTALTVDLSSEKRTVAKVVSKRTRFGVTVFPAAEVVLVSGVEIESQGTQFRIFAEAWAKGIHNNRKKIDHGTLITLFSCDNRARITLVPGKGGGLVAANTISLGDTSGIKPGIKHKENAPVRAGCPDVSIVTLYQYLDFVGNRRPNTVKEVGIFSHSHIGGPILFDTFDTSPTIARDPNDFDARPKDFAPDNVSPAIATDTSGWPNLKAAMAPDGRWHTWGCSATTQFHDLVGAAQNHKADGDLALFTVPTTVTDNLHTTTVQEIQERTNRARVLAQMDRQFRGGSYIASAAAFLGIPVFGAAPGIGSSFGSDDFGRQFMFVDRNETPTQFAWYTEHFGPEFSPTSEGNDKGYVDYHAVQARAPVAAPAFSSEFFLFIRNLVSGSSDIFFGNGKSFHVGGVKVAFPKLTADTGMATAGVSGTLYVMVDTSDDSKSVGLLMQQDGRLFRIIRDVNNKFTVASFEVV